MLELNGKYNKAKVFTDHVESSAISQIINMLNQPFVKDSKVRIMPDTHAGAGCTIGTTMTITDKVVPNLVGVDIGCGMLTTMLKTTHIELKDLDECIKKNIPSGFNIRNKPHELVHDLRLNELRCENHVDLNRAELSLGTLGGGNHFIEVNVDEDGTLYLVIHSGSRNLGKQVAEYYQNLAVKSLQTNQSVIDARIKELKTLGKQAEIQTEIAKLRPEKFDKQLAYLTDQNLLDYLHDMKIMQEYAHYNRIAMMLSIKISMDLVITDIFETVHNYIDLDAMILRKGAVSAKKDERLIIPINMRDGSLICRGKGNEDWNHSAPHGAGRLMSRSAAKAHISMDDYKDSMKGIYTSSVNPSTIDESAFAYKPMQEIIDNIGPTAEITNIIKPIYNFKASE